MKLDSILTLIAIAISFLISYGLVSFYSYENSLLLGIGSFLFISTSLTLAIGVNFDLPRTKTNIKLVSGIFFFIGLIINFIFSLYNFSIHNYIILNGLLLLSFNFIIYSIYKTKQ